MYEVFYRAWWRIENGQLVPDPGAECTHLDYVDTIQEARKACSEWNGENDETELSIKAEFRSY